MQVFNLLFSNSQYSLKVPETLMSGIDSKLSKDLGFLPKISSYGLWFPKFGILMYYKQKYPRVNILATSDLSWLNV